MKHAKQNDSENRINKKDLFKKVILTAILCALSAFLFVNRVSLTNRVTNNFFPDGEKSNVHSSFLGNHVAEQPFIAESDSIGSIGLYFSNNKKEASTGTILVELIDSVGTSVSNTRLDASLITDRKPTKFLLGADSAILNGNHKVNLHDNYRIPLKKGERYTLRITGQDIQCDGGIELLLYEDAKTNNDETLFASIDGDVQQNTRLYMYTKNDVYSKRMIALFAALILAALLFVLLPFRRMGSFSKWISRVMFVLTPPLAYFIVQKYVEYDVAGFIRHIMSDPLKPALNLLIIGFVAWLLYTVCNSTRMASVFTMLFFSAFGFINYMLVQFRGSPLVFTDLEQLGTALQVANAYTVTINRHLLWAVTLTVLWCVVCIASPRHKGLALKKRIIPVAVLIVWFAALYYSIFVASFIEDHEMRVSSFSPTVSYYRNGCPLSFMITWKYAIVSKPAGYDPANIEALAEQYPSDEAKPAKKVSAETPNVIFVMNESFSDLSVLGDLETNQDYMPFYRSLKENTIKGWMYSSVYGGSTANSEFECLTGFSSINLPLQSVAYRSVIKEETPSLTYCMKADGYGGNIAFHPGTPVSYNRNVVYPLLGFDRHIAKTELENPGLVRDFVSDEYDYKIVEQEYEKFRAGDASAPFYMFNVTIQNHGGYAYSTGVVDAGIEAGSGEIDYELERQFMNLMKLSDEALEQLIEYYSNVDEETVIVLFGDHQPKLSEEYYSNMKAQHEGISDLEWAALVHKVPFMIWANYDIGAASHKTEDAGTEDGELYISANYISAYLKQMLGMPMTGFDKYLLDMYNELPVINAIFYEDSEGNIYKPDDRTEFKDRLNEYGQIQYNGLIDYRNRVDEFFNLKTAD